MSREISAEDLIILKSVKQRIEELATLSEVGKEVVAPVSKQKNTLSVIKKRGDSPVAKDNKGQRTRDKMMSEDDADNFLIGLDLGTSRSSVVTERGDKALVTSVVGWPRDVISIKVVGKAILFGDEAVDLRESLEISFPFADGVVDDTRSRGVEAAEELIMHLLDLVEVPDGKTVCGVIGVPAKASQASKDLLLDIAKNCMDRVMLISEPFAVAYNEGALTSSLIIDVGAGTTDLCAMKGRVPDVDGQITLKKAGNYVDRMLHQALKNKFPDSAITHFLVKRLKEKYGTIEWPQKKIIVKLRVRGEYQPHDITEEMVFACSSILPDLIEGCKQLLLDFDPDFEEQALKNIILAGGMNQVKGLSTALEEAFKKFGETRVSTVKDSAYGVSRGGLKLGADIPVKFWDQIGDLGVEGR